MPAPIAIFGGGRVYLLFDVFGFLFACVWTIVVGWMTFYLTFNICKKTVLDSEGITVTFLSYKKELGWQEIKDYGLSYSGKAKADGNVYDFYFATEEQVQKNNFRKHQKRKIWKNNFSNCITCINCNAYG